MQAFVEELLCTCAHKVWQGLSLGRDKAWLWRERLEDLCGKWNQVTSQHNQKGEGGLRGILGGRYMLDQKKSGGGLEPPLEEGKEPRMMKGSVSFERGVVSGGVRLRSLPGKGRDGRAF